MVGGSDVSGEKLKLHGNYFPGGSISPSLSLSSLCIGGKTIFVESDPTEGRKKARSAASCIGSKQIGQDPINSWKRRGAINDANGRSARIKKAAYERRVKSFFFPPPVFRLVTPLDLDRFLISLLWKREERRECNRRD